MIVHCDACDSDFRLPDDKVSPEGTWVRCSKCSEVFQVFAEGGSPGRQSDDLAMDLGDGLDDDLGLGPARGSGDDDSDFDLDLDESGGGRSGLGRIFGLLFWIVGIILVLALLGGGALVAMDRLGMGKGVVDMARGWPVLNLVLTQPKVPEGYLDLIDVTGVLRDNLNSGRILVIKGTVINRFKQPRQSIVVRARLSDSQGKVVRQATAYAGNVFSDEELRQLSVEALQKRQTSPASPSGAPFVVPPEGRLPFNVVIADVPETASEFQAEAVASEPSPGAGQ